MVKKLSGTSSRAGRMRLGAVPGNRNLASRGRSKALGEHGGDAYRELVENADSMMLSVDPAGKILFLNDFAERFFGYTSDEIIGKNVKMLLPPQGTSGQDLRKMVDAILRDPDSLVENTNENILRDGTRVWILWRNRAVRDRRGRVVRILATGQDITGLKKSEEALRSSEQRFRSLFENSLDGMMVTVTDGTILSVNARMCEMLGMTEEEIRRAGREHIVVKDERLPAALEERRRTGRFRGELTMRRKDGSLLPVEVSTITFVDLDGAVKSGHVVRDISEHKQSEELLRRAQNELEFRVEQRTTETRRQAELLNLAHDAVIVWGKNGLISFWNTGAEEIYGWTREEAMGRSIRRFLHTDFPVSLQETMTAIERNRRWEGELVQTRKDGARIVVLSRWALHGEPASGDTEIMEVNSDITTRKEAEEALRTAGAYNRNLVEASLDPLVAIGPDGTITDVNAATERITGCHRTELVGTDFSDYFTEPEKARTVYRRVFKEGLVRDYELEVKHRDGHTTPVLYNASIYRDKSGEVVGVFAAARDITERKHAEDELLNKSKALEELNTALKVLIDHYKNDQRELEERIVSNIGVRIIPYIEKLRQTGLNIGQAALVEIIERSFRDITSPFSKVISSQQFRFTVKETEVASLIRDGKTTKEIARFLSLSKRTVDSYRDSIRGKLGLTDRKVNLRTCLLSIRDT